MFKKFKTVALDLIWLLKVAYKRPVICLSVSSLWLRPIAMPFRDMAVLKELLFSKRRLKPFVRLVSVRY